MNHIQSKHAVAGISLKTIMTVSLSVLFLSGCIGFNAIAKTAAGNEYHVSVTGNDADPGSREKPLRTIQAAADIAQPGDTITVHEGTYRERINPPRGGESDERRIVYRAAEDADVVIKGSEQVTDWKQVEGETWMARIPNTFFGDHNPYGIEIYGDWFRPLGGHGRVYHTGTVYLNGHWLTEAASRKDVVSPAGSGNAGEYLFNVLWMQIAGKQNSRIASTEMSDHKGLRTAPALGEGCIGFIRDGHWAKYDGVDFGTNAEAIEFRVASQSAGGIIEIRLDAPDGDLLGKCAVPGTGDWQAWKTTAAQIVPTSGEKTVCLVFRAAPPTGTKPAVWFAEVDGENTTIWADFQGANPNEELVEINVREAVFYPEKTGVNYITVRGFTMEHAAPNWAPPTAEQVGLIGTHWSKGWVIEDNTIRYSICTGVTLGKYGDEWDNAWSKGEWPEWLKKEAQKGTGGYVASIRRALENDWSRANIGSHIVRNNRISHCEQAGIVGSMGAVFSTVTGNSIHDINMRGMLGGAEMAGIKFHGAIDSLISHNHVYRCGGHGGIWLDWMTQGTRVTGNLLHDNHKQDLFVEVNHGPFLVDNNIFLSEINLLESSGGGAYAHNLFHCRISLRREKTRETPYHRPHSTEVLGLSMVVGDDERFHNNLFAGNQGLSVYNAWKPDHLQAVGNIYLAGSRPSLKDRKPLIDENFDPSVRLSREDGGWWLEMAIDPAWALKSKREIVTTETLGKAEIPDVSYENPDGTPYRLDTDYFGRERDIENVNPGPFVARGDEKVRLKVWPREQKRD